MPRAGLNVDAVIDAAATIADSEGLRSLTLARLATALRVKAPSLYNHIDCLGTLKAHLTARALSMLLDRTRDTMAGVAGQEALTAFGRTQRQFAKSHPGLWSAFKLPVAGWSESTQSTSDAYLALALTVMRGYRLSGDDAIHATRAIRASLQGFIDLELGGGFGLGQKVDLSFEALLKMLHVSLSQYQVGTRYKQLHAAK